LTDQWRHYEISSDDGSYPKISSGFHDSGFESANEVGRTLALFNTDCDSVPCRLIEWPTQYPPLAGISEDFNDNQSKSLASIAAIAGSSGDYDSNQKPTRFHKPVAGNRPVERWASSYERHESIAYRLRKLDDSGIRVARLGFRKPSPEQWHNKLRAMIQSDGGKKSYTALNESKDWNERASGSGEESSTSSISDLRRVFDERVKTLLENDPGLVTRLIHHIAPKLHLLGPLFKGDGLLSLLEENVANDGEQEQGSQPASSSTSQNFNGISSWTSQNTGGPSKRPGEQRQDGDDNNKRSKRNEQNPIPHLPPGDTREKPKFKCPFYAKCCIVHCRKNGRASTSSGYDTIHHIQE
jgi:hypothetical protein